MHGVNAQLEIDPDTGEVIDPNVLAMVVDQKTSHLLIGRFCDPSYAGECVDENGIRKKNQMVHLN